MEVFARPEHEDRRHGLALKNFWGVRAHFPPVAKFLRTCVVECFGCEDTKT